MGSIIKYSHRRLLSFVVKIVSLEAIFISILGKLSLRFTRSNMTEEQILKAIADACEDDTLRFQIIIQDGVLYVYINRPAKAELDYQELESKIQAAIDNTNLDFKEIALYSRVLGKIEPDWQSVPNTEASRLDSGQISSMMKAITDAVEATNSIVERIERELDIPESFAEPVDFEELPTTADDSNSNFNSSTIRSIDNAIWKLDLNQYCFIRNQRLLYSVLSPPKENIAQLVDIFHLFEQSIQRSQLPILQQYFDSSVIPDLDSFHPEVQSWWTAIIMLDSDRRRQLAIWLSRYCMHPEQTSSTVREVLYPTATLENATDSSAFNSNSQNLSGGDRDTIGDRNKPGLLPNLKTMLQKFWGTAEDK